MSERVIICVPIGDRAAQLRVTDFATRRGYEVVGIVDSTPEGIAAGWRLAWSGAADVVLVDHVGNIPGDLAPRLEAVPADLNRRPVDVMAFRNAGGRPRVLPRPDRSPAAEPSDLDRPRILPR
ncbi:hypothetical protein [Rugosimonospora africana]|uniref:Uncharacterized protein n=1 Tax=Rugosimonospora africana TaxID=556532 RepID=A0A8J3QUW9_9ACTN|nr:hypothetical protein [Rugosimonospora africana]GIH16250.1 hypothetical protein Raf01_44220 [Rugosimonospora africana]